MQNGEVLGVILVKCVEIFFNILSVSSCSTFREGKKKKQPMHRCCAGPDRDYALGTWSGIWKALQSPSSNPCSCPAPPSLQSYWLQGNCCCSDPLPCHLPSKSCAILQQLKLGSPAAAHNVSENGCQSIAVPICGGSGWYNVPTTVLSLLKVEKCCGFREELIARD